MSTSEHRYTFTLECSKSSDIHPQPLPFTSMRKTSYCRLYPEWHGRQHGGGEWVSNPVMDCRQEMGKGQLMQFTKWHKNLSVETATWTTWADIDSPLCTAASCRCLHNPIILQRLAVLIQSQERLWSQLMRSASQCKENRAPKPTGKLATPAQCWVLHRYLPKCLSTSWQLPSI